MSHNDTHTVYIPDGETQCALSWHRRHILSGGGYGLVYHIVLTPTRTCAVKVGHVAPREAEVQRALAERSLALPVYAYASQVQLPNEIDREVCGRHGWRAQDWGVGPIVTGVSCTCGRPRDILVMPVAQVVSRDGSLDRAFRHQRAEVEAFMAHVAQVCAELFGLAWDRDMRNIARYRQRWVALDFGPAVPEQ